MHKVIRVICLLIVFTVGFSPISVFSESDKRIVLTYEEAVETALKNSYELRKLTNEYKRADEKSDNLEYDLSFYDPEYDPYSSKFTYFSSQSQTIQFEKQQALRSQDNSIENIKLMIASSFNNIDKINKELALLNEKLLRSGEKVDLARIKLDVGFISEAELNTALNDLNLLRDTKKEKLEALNLEYLELSKVMNTDIDPIVKIQPLNYEYEVFNQTENEIQFKGTKAIENNILVWGKEQEVEFKDLAIDIYFVSIPPINTGDTLGQEPYRVKKIDKSIAENELSKVENDVREAVKEKYQNIKNLEVLIESLQQRVSILDTEIDLMEVRFLQGLIIRDDIKDMELQKKELNNSIYELKKQHEFLKQIYNNNYLAGF